MKFIEYDSDNLINFYKENGLEFNKSQKYFGSNVKSYVLKNDKDVVGAVTVSTYKNKNFIEALAVDKKYRHKGYGKLLIEKVIHEIKNPIFTISKVDEFYLKNGFVYSDEDVIGEECKTCNRYNNTCFPKVMVYRR